MDLNKWREQECGTLHVAWAKYGGGFYPQNHKSLVKRWIIHVMIDLSHLSSAAAFDFLPQNFGGRWGPTNGDKIMQFLAEKMLQNNRLFPKLRGWRHSPEILDPPLWAGPSPRVGTRMC